MLIKTLCAGALLAGTGMAWGALCTQSPANLGTLSGNPGEVATFSAACTAFGLSNPNDPATWTFTNTFNFRLEEAATNLWGGVNLNFVRTYQVFPNSPTRGDPLFMISTDAIWLVHNGVTTFAGSEGAGHNEHANIFALDLEAGDYQMVVRGRVFDIGARSGWYNGTIGVSYANPASAATVAAPVPEPATTALLLLGVPLVAWAAGRRRGVSGSPTLKTG